MMQERMLTRGARMSARIMVSTVVNVQMAETSSRMARASKMQVRASLANRSPDQSDESIDSIDQSEDCIPDHGTVRDMLWQQVCRSQRPDTTRVKAGVYTRTVDWKHDVSWGVSVYQVSFGSQNSDSQKYVTWLLILSISCQILYCVCSGGLFISCRHSTTPSLNKVSTFYQ